MSKLDKILTHKVGGYVIMAVVLYLVFDCTFRFGAYPQHWIEVGITALCDYLNTALPQGWLTSLFVDGIVQGVGTVLSFLPNICILFILLSILEDSGYMARLGFLMDKIMHKLGLHGSSFVPMLVGFGCNVPAIIDARSIENPKDRTLTMLMIPFMSCSARLPVYLLFVSAFFAQYKALVMISLYLIGIVLSICFALIMKRTRWFRQDIEDPVHPLPPMTAPSFRHTGRHIWNHVKDYLQKIVTVIIWASVIIWALSYFPTHELETSYLAMIGQAIAPVFAPLGFDWQMVVCLLSGLPAKEAIVSTMGILAHGGGTLSVFTPLTAFGFMVFVLLYFPCVATITTLRKEIGRRWAWFTVIHSLLLAWLLSFAIYQIGSLF
ncbi:MAG: ferrous iron transport protein B [Paludibacteraceae bacterium]|nr:ferrous iron transport protein B [Paludibacteraceae bacterium]